MPAMSRSARRAILTGYAVLGFKLVKELPYGPFSSLFHILQTLTNAFPGIG
jgi:hypothetical protein